MRHPEGTRELKLKIELVPSTSWYNNLRNKMDKCLRFLHRKSMLGSGGAFFSTSFISLASLLQCLCLNGQLFSLLKSLTCLK